MPIGVPKEITECRRFFREPQHSKQRQYEALRRYFVDERSSKEVAAEFGYTEGSFRVLCHHFRRDPAPAFFLTPVRGPQSQPKKSAARVTIELLRKRNHSVYEIAEALKEQGTPLSATAVREVLRELGFAALPRRLDEGLGLFCALNRIPKKSYLSEYSSRVTPKHTSALLGAWHGAVLGEPALFPAQSFDLDFHSVPYHGAHPSIERHYVSKRSRRQPSILVFLAHDADARAFCYADADLRKGEEPEAVFGFLAFWQRTHGALPAHVVFDSRLTTYAGLARLDAMGVTFITLRRRSPKILAEIRDLPVSAWRRIRLDVPARKYRTPRVWEKKVTLAGCRLRQLYILDLGHDKPTVLLTNDTRTPNTLITRYAQRMLIENAICDAVRFFHIDALSSAVAMKVDFDMTLLVIASGLYRRLAQRMRGYAQCQARQVFRDLIDMPADVTITEGEVQVRFHRRAHLPIIAASGLLDEPVTVPWWNGMSLPMEV